MSQLCHIYVKLLPQCYIIEINTSCHALNDDVLYGFCYVCKYVMQKVDRILCFLMILVVAIRIYIGLFLKC